jgi:hypothetical protein
MSALAWWLVPVVVLALVGAGRPGAGWLSRFRSGAVFLALGAGVLFVWLGGLWQLG